ncbi:MAG: zinc ribbon domain-containing protein [Chloroflexi bacterium]|nr:zinc ribbon domain-containing protein [Chloroflexota bacterium]
MPVYEYYCPSCKSRFELLRPMDRMEAQAPCPECDTSSRKVLSVFVAVTRDAEGFISSYSGAAGASGGGCACGGACSCSA